MEYKSAASNLDGRTVLITGGTSGIGLQAAIQAQNAGAKVIVLGSDAHRTASIAAEHGFAGWRAADVANAAEVERALADIMHVDHLALLAGSFIVGKVADADMGRLRRAFDERVWAAIHILRTLGDRLAPDGSVTFVSGAATDRPSARGTAVISAAAAAMEALARGLALEQAPRRFNTLSPGPIDTPILTKALGDAKQSAVDHLSSTLPLGRLGSAEEAGAAVLFLMTNGWMNAATLNLDGGFRLV